LAALIGPGAVSTTVGGATTVKVRVAVPLAFPAASTIVDVSVWLPAPSVVAQLQFPLLSAVTVQRVVAPSPTVTVAKSSVLPERVGLAVASELSAGEAMAGARATVSFTTVRVAEPVPAGLDCVAVTVRLGPSASEETSSVSPNALPVHVAEPVTVPTVTATGPASVLHAPVTG
jgi:hypothetical protein